MDEDVNEPEHRNGKPVTRRQFLNRAGKFVLATAAYEIVSLTPFLAGCDNAPTVGKAKQKRGSALKLNAEDGAADGCGSCVACTGCTKACTVCTACTHMCTEGCVSLCTSCINCTDGCTKGCISCTKGCTSGAVSCPTCVACTDCVSCLVVSISSCGSCIACQTFTGCVDCTSSQITPNG